MSAIIIAFHTAGTQELTENNASEWSTFAGEGTFTSVANDTEYVKEGSYSIKFETESGWDTGVKYPANSSAHWDITSKNYLVFWIYAINNNLGFQGHQPVVVLNCPNGSYKYTAQGECMYKNRWFMYKVPLSGDDFWVLTTEGSPTMSNINQIEIHHDTWDAGFILYYDGLKFVRSIPNAVYIEDLTVCFISRLPKLNYVAGSTDPTRDGWPAVGEQVTWQAQVKNFSQSDKENILYKWYLDGTEVGSGQIDILAGSAATIDFLWNWVFERHELELVIDADNTIPEIEEENNNLLIYTDAISLGFYVEQSLYDYFLEHQTDLGVHTTCFENWAQILHVKRWNQMFADAIYPETPDGVIDRIRLDKITIVNDFALPLAGGTPTNNPNRADSTVDLQWGFPGSLLGGTLYNNTTTISDENAFYFEGSLLHELGYWRYLLDNYGFNVHVNNENFIDIEENGEPIVGTKYMPFAAWDVVYYTPISGLMSSNYTVIDPYNTKALNLIAGERPPHIIGIYLNRDLPDANCLTVKDSLGNILANAAIKIFQCTEGGPTWYGKHFDNIPDFELKTDENGQIFLGRCPFDNDGIIEHGFPTANGVIIIRVEHEGKVGYTFFEATSLNMEYWRGNTSLGHHEIHVTLHEKPPLNIQIEAENYNYMSGIQIENCSEGGKNVGYIHPGDWMSYTVNIPSAGTYTIEYRIASPNSDGRFRLDRDSGSIIIDDYISVPNTGSWQNWTTVIKTVHLDAGEYYLGIYAYTGDWNLNWFCISGNGDELYKIRIETENWNYVKMIGGEPAVQNETCSEDGQNVGWIHTGDWMSYQVNIPVTGTYQIQYRLASPNSTGLLRLDMDSGSIILDDNVSVPNTGGWQTWTTVTNAINLDAGQYYLGIYAITGGWNINWFEISGSTAKSKPGKDNYEQISIPAAFSLYQNYPNPFNAYTQIRYSLPEQVFAALKIYNIRGQEVVTLVEEEQPAGNYSLNFNASEFNSGVYFYSLEAGDYRNIKRMVFIK
jgi:hypothetical protein